MYYFAYGANLSKKLMKERCPDSKPLLLATLPNYKLIFTGWSRQWRGGIASIRPLRGQMVIGAVYEVSENDLRQLDKQESINNYQRLKVTVYSGDDKPIEAITYVKTGQLEETSASKEFLAIVQQGYKDWGIV